jgi:phosphomannomutase
LTDSGKKLSELIDEYRRYSMIPEMNIETAGDKEAIYNRLRSAFSDDEQDELDGLTVWLGGGTGWFNLRASNTEPVMRLNAEAADQVTLDELVAKVTGLIAG